MKTPANCAGEKEEKMKSLNTRILLALGWTQIKKAKGKWFEFTAPSGAPYAANEVPNYVEDAGTVIAAIEKKKISISLRKCFKKYYADLHYEEDQESADIFLGTERTAARALASAFLKALLLRKKK